jgi:transcriptional regulator with XRE-family HTH domain
LDNKLPNLIDKHVGRRMRWRRKEVRLSQEALAERLGVTFQQVQKYERGANRVSAGRLYEIARALETTIPYFFHGAEAVEKAVRKRGLAEDDDEEFSGLIDQDAVDLVIAFQSIRDPKLRKSILTMVKQQAVVFQADQDDQDEAD